MYRVCRYFPLKTRAFEKYAIEFELSGFFLCFLFFQILHVAFTAHLKLLKMIQYDFFANNKVFMSRNYRSSSCPLEI